MSKKRPPAPGPAPRMSWSNSSGSEEQDASVDDPFAFTTVAPTPSASTSRRPASLSSSPPASLVTRSNSLGNTASSSPRSLRDRSPSTPTAAAATGNSNIPTATPAAAAAAAASSMSASAMTPPRGAPPHLTGHAHLTALLQRMGKKLAQSASARASSTSPSIVAAASSSAFDVALRNSLIGPKSSRAELMRDLTHELSPSIKFSPSHDSPSQHRFLGYEEDKFEFDLDGKRNADDETMEDVPAVAAAAVAVAEKSKQKMTRNTSPPPTARSLPPRTLASTYPPSSTSASSVSSAASKRVSMKSSSSQSDAMEDDDSDAPFSFAADGAIAKEKAALAASDRKRAASKALASSMNLSKRKRLTPPSSQMQSSQYSNASQKSNQKESSITAALRTNSLLSRTMTNRTSSNHSSSIDADEEDEVEDPFDVRIQFTPSPKVVPPITSPPPTSSKPAAATSTSTKPAIQRKVSKPMDEVYDDPFEVELSPATSILPLRSPPPTSSNIAAGLPPQMPTLQRTTSGPSSHSTSRPLPPHVAVAMAAAPPKRTGSGSTTLKLDATSNSGRTSPALGTSTSGRTSPSPATATAPPPAPPSELLEQRRTNLAQKSNTMLLLEALLGKPSPELREIENSVLTPAQRVLLQKRPIAPTNYVTLASKLGRKLKKKSGAGVGFNAKQRSRGRRTDGFVGDMNPVLERVVDHLLTNGADPNGRDADKNHALWLAIQLKGSERVIKMLLDKGAECVHAEESEDDTSSEEEDEDDEKEEKSGKENRPRAIKDSLKPDLLSRAAVGIGKGPSAAATSSSSDDPLTYERGSTVDLAMKLGLDRITVMLLRAGHLPSRNGRIRLMDYAKLHGFANEASQILSKQLWVAVKDANYSLVADCIRHMDRRMVDTKELTGRTPLYHAVEQKDPSIPIISLLLRAGANPNQCDCSQTPMAVFPLCRQAKKSSDVIELLIRHGLNPLLQVSDSGQSLIEFAKEAAARPESIEALQRTVDIKEKVKLAGTDQDVFRFTQ